MSEIKMKIGLTPKGAYSSSTTYDYLDYVTEADGIYTSKQASNVGHALTETDWWEHSFVAPKLQINSTSKNWEISYDGGTTYVDTGISAKGADGKSEFDGVQTVTGSAITMEIQPNILYVFNNVTSLSLTLATPTDTTRVNEYMFQFTSGTTATTLTLPSSIKWISSNGIAASMIYQVSIVNNLAVMGGTSNA